MNTQHPYQLTFEHRPDYLYAHVTAPAIDEDGVMDYLRRVADECREHKYDRLLLHRDIPTIIPIGKLFFVAAEFKDIAAGVKIAWVNRYLSNTDSLNFAVTVGTNRGADHALFGNETDAERWLAR